MAIKGIIFDFNGTLFFDTPLHNRAWDVILKRYSCTLSDEDKSRVMHGKNNTEIIKTILPEKLSDGEIKMLSKEKEEIYRQLCLQQKMELAPGAEDFLEFLVQRKLPFTIATSSEIDNLNFYFEQFRLERYFDRQCVIYDDGSMKSKPDPEIFLRAMNMLKTDAAHTLIFEDSASGIKAAERSLASKVIIVNSTDAVHSSSSHQIIRSFAEVDRTLFD